MSTFNTRKDRLPSGKAKPHYHIDFRSRPAAKYVHPGDRWPRINVNKNPAWWNRLYTTRKRRADDRANLNRVIQGWDLDGLVWAVNNRPTEYYW